MKISLCSTGLKDWDGSVLIIGLFAEELNKQIESIDLPCKRSLTDRLKEQEFTAKDGELISFDFPENKPSKLILVGLGKAKNLVINDFRNAAALSARASIGRIGKLGIFFPWSIFDHESAAQAVGEAIRLALFKDLRFKSKPEPFLKTNHVELIGVNQSAESCLSKLSPLCAGVELARELVGAPPNNITPTTLAEAAILISKEYGLQSRVLNKQECGEKGMGAYLAVSQGSDLEPKFIHLIYKAEGPIKKRIAMVGKGLTFDSGGYNLKVGAAQIDMMKFDMGGSAAVLGAARAIGELKPENVEVHFIVAACENMINGSAVHPGDIVKASNGKTIEINNTDAEGRLTLADALVYACELEPDAIVDLATLTGACVIALGDEIAGLWTENEQLAGELINAAKASGEGIWRMPMHGSYKEGLKSMLADIKNTGPRAGGSITAGLFLKEFVEESIPWAHIDIAGTVWADKDRGIDPAGATGYGVRTLVKWTCDQLNN